MSWHRVAVFVAHPAHLLTVAGLIQRYQPHVLIWTEPTVDGKAAPAVVRAGLDLLGLTPRTVCLDVSESRSYRWAYEGAVGPFEGLRDRILDWLRDVQPDAVLGDAFELSNFQHDVGRALLDAALRVYRVQEPTVRNYEFPLSCRTAADLDQMRYQAFPQGPHETFCLSEQERRRKEEVLGWAASMSDFIATVAPLFPRIDEEPYRPVPWYRDYASPPPGLERHYDDYGRMLARRGALAQPILFE